MSIFPVALDGWDQLSTWGWDETQGCLYAQLTPNGESDDNGPKHWLTPPVLNTRDQAVLVAEIARRTGRTEQEVDAALGSGPEAPADDDDFDQSDEGAHQMVQHWYAVLDAHSDDCREAAIAEANHLGADWDDQARQWAGQHIDDGTIACVCGVGTYPLGDVL